LPEEETETEVLPFEILDTDAAEEQVLINAAENRLLENEHEIVEIQEQLHDESLKEKIAEKIHEKEMIVAAQKKIELPKAVQKDSDEDNEKSEKVKENSVNKKPKLENKKNIDLELEKELNKSGKKLFQDGVKSMEPEGKKGAKTMEPEGKDGAKSMEPEDKSPKGFGIKEDGKPKLPDKDYDFFANPDNFK